MTTLSKATEQKTKKGNTVKHFVRNGKGPHEINFVYKVLKKNTLVK